jgi:ABC-type polysaccharide/polyol phosphate export permease
MSSSARSCTLITNIIQISMLITPIFWAPDFLKGGARLLFVDFNPLHHLIDIVRDPLLGRVPPLLSYVVVAVLAAGGWALTYWFFRHFRKRISYWA